MDRQSPTLIHPDGLGLVPSDTLYEYTDVRNEAATLTRWQPVLDRLGIEALEIADVPTRPMRLTVDGIEWEVRPLGADRVERVPADVYARYQGAVEAKVPFAWWLWGEEQFIKPTFLPMAEPAPAAPTPSVADRVLRFGRQQRQEAQEWWARVDPILIGVIPTAPGRGVWCKLGAWFH